MIEGLEKSQYDLIKIESPYCLLDRFYLETNTNEFLTSGKITIFELGSVNKFIYKVDEDNLSQFEFNYCLVKFLKPEPTKTILHFRYFLDDDHKIDSIEIHTPDRFFVKNIILGNIS